MGYLTNIMQLAGGIILSVGYIPQIVRIIKTKSVDDFSFQYLFYMVLGIGLMEVYAVYNALQGSAIMFLVTNTLSLLTSSTMLVLYFIYRKK